MDFTIYIYVMIGSRLEKKIDELYKTKTEFLKKLDDDDKKKNKRFRFTNKQFRII